MRYKIGRVSYINSLPLFCADFPFDCEIIKGYPEFLNSLCAKGQLDISLISLWSYGSIKENYEILPNFCIASDGAVKSVLLYSNYSIENLKGKKIYLTGESKSSVDAFKAYCLEKFSFNPEDCRVRDIAEAEAVFLIGNPALAFNGAQYKFKYDFGVLWKEHFGLPIVYSVAVVKKEIFASVKDALMQTFSESLKSFSENKEKFCALSTQDFEDLSMSPDAVREYFESLIFELDAEVFKKSLELAKKYGAFGQS